CKQYYSTPYSF
nr:immunoglobulin light chain junction region [Macaca mulatta]